MLDTASKKTLTDIGIDVAALTTAITATDEQPYKVILKTGEIKTGDSTLHIYDDAGHNGLIGRVKNETLAQSTELGVKAVAKQFAVDYTGNDPAKLQEAVVAKLNLPLDDKIKDKDKDIATMTKNWNDEKALREAAETKFREREELDRDISFFPDNRIKTFKDKTLRTELKEEGITFGEYEVAGVKKPAVFVNGEVKKNADLTLVDPKTFTAEHFKTKGWIAPETTPPPGGKKTLDVQGKQGKPDPQFDHQSNYDRVVQKYGGWTDKAQAEYTQAMIGDNKVATA